MDGKSEITRDRLLSGKISLSQMKRGHRAGTDAVLLAAAVAAVPGRTIADVGAGTGAIGLMLAAAKPDAEILCIEQDEGLADLCQRNILDNDCAKRVSVANVDIFEASTLGNAKILPESMEIVVTNPPFLEEGQARLSPDARRRKAHSMPTNGLERWLAFCGYLLKAKGTLAVIHRADKLAECLAHLPSGFGAVRIRAIHPYQNEKATRILVMAIRGRKSPLMIEAPLILHNEDHSFTSEAQALHDGLWLNQNPPTRHE